jgi:hypothetical protein
MNCRSRGRTTVGIGVVALAAALFAAAGAGSGSATRAARASAASLQFPPQTPRWLVEAETRTASGLGDPNATVISVTLGRFPIVVLEGKFVCNACSHGPSGAAAPTGNYAATRFDGVTHQSSDFGLSQTLAAATASLCNGSRCTTNATYLDAAFRALDAHSRAVSEPFDHRFGSSHCKIRLPVSEIKWIWGSCQVQMRANSSGATVTFREAWNGLDASGHRYAADSPKHHHLYIVTESREAFVTSFQSTGDRPPQWRR